MTESDIGEFRMAQASDADQMPKPKQSRKERLLIERCKLDQSLSTTQALEATKESLVLERSLPIPMSAARALPLLVCSVGNPGSVYANTLHSAGHTVLKHLAERLGYTQYTKDRSHGNGLISKPTSSENDWTLWQSTSYMNESGKGVKAAYQTWSRNIPDGEGKLIVVHDELEKPLGAVSLRTAQGASAKGHNGLKSIMSAMGGTPFARIGVGIGRPVSRDSNDVAKYVLKKMTPAEKAVVEGAVDEVIKKLLELQKG